MKSSIPFSRQNVRVSFWTSAVTAIIGIPAFAVPPEEARSSERISATASHPSFSGICRSIKTMSGASLLNERTASSPSDASMIRAPGTSLETIRNSLPVEPLILGEENDGLPVGTQRKRNSLPGQVRPLSVRCFFRFGVASCAEGEEEAASLAGCAFQLEAALIFCSSASRIVMPSPTPPYYLVLEASAWKNGSKSLRWTSGAIPMPVSLTENV